MTAYSKVVERRCRSYKPMVGCFEKCHTRPRSPRTVSWFVATARFLAMRIAMWAHSTFSYYGPISYLAERGRALLGA